jgi:hypothetical protein
MRLKGLGGVFSFAVSCVVLSSTTRLLLLSLLRCHGPP